MKQRFSIFLLMARSTGWKVLAILAAMTALQQGMTWYGCRNGDVTMEELLQMRFLWAPMAPLLVGFLLLTLVLGSTGTDGKVRTVYTIRRLAVEEKEIFLWQSLYNGLCYLLFWVVAAASVLGMCAIHGALCDRGPQSVFLAFHSNRTLHALIPFEEYSFLVRNLLYLLVMSLVTAQYPMIQRQGSKNYFYLMTAAIVCLRFPGRTGNFGNNLVDIVLSAIILLAVGWWVYGKEVDVDVPSA